MNTAVGNHRNLSIVQQGYYSQGQYTIPLVSSANLNESILLHSYSAYNANSSACDVGLGIGFNTAKWGLYQLTGGGTIATKASAPYTLFDTVANDGFLIGSTFKFGYVVLNLSQAQAGSPVYTYQYWNGTSWATLVPMQTPVYTSTGYVYLTFNPPADWVVGSNGLISSSLSYYAIKVASTTAGSQAVLATSVQPARWLYYQQNLPGGSRLLADFNVRPWRMEGSEVLLPYFSIASQQNTVEASYQVAP